MSPSPSRLKSADLYETSLFTMFRQGLPFCITITFCAWSIQKIHKQSIKPNIPPKRMKLTQFFDFLGGQGLNSIETFRPTWSPVWPGGAPKSEKNHSLGLQVHPRRPTMIQTLHLQLPNLTFPPLFDPHLRQELSFLTSRVGGMRRTPGKFS